MLLLCFPYNRITLHTALSWEDTTRGRHSRHYSTEQNVYTKPHILFTEAPSLPTQTVLCGSVCAQSLSHVQLFVTPWSVAHQAPPSMEFSRKEHRSGLPFPPSGIVSTQRSNPHLLHWQVDPLPPEPCGKPFVWEGVLRK